MYKNIFSLILVPVLFFALAMPANAANQFSFNSSNNNSQQQQLNYLYSVIAQLQAQLAVLQGNRQFGTTNQVFPFTSGSVGFSNDISRVTTGGVSSDGNDSVELAGAVTFRRDSDARVWFEYGTNLNLSFSTESIDISGDAGDSEDFEIDAIDLDDNRTYYYRAVAEDDDGLFIEGTIRSFSFNGQSNNRFDRFDDDDDDDDDDDNDNDDWSLDLDDDTFETGDAIRVEYTVEDENNDNYIALFESGDDNDDYISRVFIDDEDGFVTFRIFNEGEYEFRLFDEDEDVQAETDEFEVDN